MFDTSANFLACATRAQEGAIIATSIDVWRARNTHRYQAMMRYFFLSENGSVGSEQHLNNLLRTGGRDRLWATPVTSLDEAWKVQASSKAPFHRPSARDSSSGRSRLLVTGLPRG